ncbi:ferredoxin [Rhodococcus sp. IEGM 1305]|uniref:ferredoxin n=1 Tax=Rhodococcus sp. IEGM 1305 TaxID=3047092 RepID=UPI0024B7D274|nr:ferredoxin [Rhodococcus sp. IEGM 1305]MDI9953305.1 ferredoxin [Rhodococcus sp. IEGM 1305]
MKVSVNMDQCEYHGQCVFAAPDLFDITDDGELEWVESPDPTRSEALKAAVGACPVQAITLQEG